MAFSYFRVIFLDKTHCLVSSEDITKAMDIAKKTYSKDILVCIKEKDIELISEVHELEYGFDLYSIGMA